MRALLYDGRRSGAQSVTVTLVGSDSGHRLEVRGTELATDVALADVRLDARVGRAPPIIQLPDGASLEVLDVDEFDAALAGTGQQPGDRAIRWLEHRWRVALAAVVVVAVGSWAFVVFGVPVLASRIVDALPPRVDAQIGASTLSILDRGVFKPSGLSEERQVELSQEFGEIAASAPAGKDYRLVFRKGGPLGPNAFALPSGVVVLTDELEDVAQDDDELRAVFAHEIGHLVHRHAMRTLVQGSATAVLMLTLFGDASSATSLAAVAPGAIVTAAYSRDFEREADAFSFQWMAAHGLPPERLGDLLARLAKKQPGVSDGFLSSHPGLGERVRAAKEFAGHPR